MSGIERPTDPAEVRDWIFTFGFDHELAGESLARRFVRIRGTHEEARAEMLRRFGRKWAFQYESAEAAGADRYNLTEISLPGIAAAVKS